MMKKIKILFIGGMLILILGSCARPVTLVTGTWTNDEVDKNYDRVLVAALTSNVSFKSKLEDALAQQLEDKGVKASKSIDLLPPEFIEDENQKQTIMENIQADGIDGILTVSILAKTTETRYVPGSYHYEPVPLYGFYGHFWAYYDYWYPRFHEPGYYTEKTYYLETNLYDAESEKLVWSAQSQIYSPNYFNTFTEDFAAEITATMAREDVIGPS